MRLDKFDLNLLVAFDVLIEERNVTRAARRLNLTQSAMSGALRRLRDAFGDEILVQHGKKMFPTPAALALASEISAVVADLRGLLAKGLSFNPLTSDRIFRIVASDYLAIILIGPLLQQLQQEAPNVRIDLVLPHTGAHESLEDGEIDLIISPERFLEGLHPRELLLEERHVVVGWSGNPLLKGPLTQEVYDSCGHVVVNVTSQGTFADNYLREHGDRRRIEVNCAAFSQVAWVLPGTTRLAVMHERLAKWAAGFLPLRICEPPMAMPIMREMLQYHQARAEDPGIRWLSKRLLEAAKLI